MGGPVLDALLIVFMLLALEWRESRWAPRSISPLRRRARTIRRPPMPCDAARRQTLEVMDRKAS